MLSQTAKMSLSLIHIFGKRIGLGFERDDLGLYLALLIGAFIQSFAAFGERCTCGVQCGTVIVGNGVRFAAQCVQLLLGIVALGSQRVALGGVILGAAGRQLYGGFLAGDEFCLLYTSLDESALQFDQILVSGGKRGLSVGVNPQDLLKVLNAVAAPIGTW